MSASGCRVAVLGGGFQGVCVALELARRGWFVDLYDRADRPITRAGLHNEGKIHLGFVYANEPSLATTRLLVRGALAFEPLIQRWTGPGALVALSTPHYYAVHRDSMLPASAVGRHLERVLAVIRDTAWTHGGSYLGRDATTIEAVRVDVGPPYDARRVVALFRTDERAVDTRALADSLRTRVSSEPRIRFSGHVRVLRVVRRPQGFTVVVSGDGGVTEASRACDQVVNCLWEGRMTVDRLMGREPDHPPLHRLKHGVFLQLRQPRDDLWSTTFVLGQFGDLVNFGDGRIYLSWYPAARTAMSRELAPPDWPCVPDPATAAAMFDSTVAAFADLVPAIRDLPAQVVERVVAGAIIVAAGRTDIDDPCSQLHGRTAIGVWSDRGYHSVDPGKYTMAPYFAMVAADRVCGALAS